MIDYASLFCGAGLFDIPFTPPEFRCVLAADSDPDACLWYRRNHRISAIPCDIREMHPTVSASLVLCTPPCQQFSLANPRAKGLDDPVTRSIFRNSARVCREMSANLVVLENVDGLVKRGWADSVLEMFADVGFTGQWRLLRASDYGVPQRRNRVMFAFSDRGFPWPVPSVSSTARDVAMTATPLADSRRLQQVPPQFELPDNRLGRRLAGEGAPLGLATAIRDSVAQFFGQEGLPVRR